MKKQVGFWIVGAVGILVVGGCASENVVKKDEAIAPAATAQAKPADLKTVKTVTAAPVTPAKLSQEASKKETPKPVSQSNDQLKAALDKIYFDFDSYTLSEQSRKTLTNNADYLRKNNNVNMRIEGNCDERGSAEYNIALGEKRAKAAMKYIVTLGVPESRLATISYGKEKPADAGHDEAAWAKNRRDDFTILSK